MPNDTQRLVELMKLIGETAVRIQRESETSSAIGSGTLELNKNCGIVVDDRIAYTDAQFKEITDAARDYGRAEGASWAANEFLNTLTAWARSQKPGN